MLGLGYEFLRPEVFLDICQMPDASWQAGASRQNILELITDVCTEGDDPRDALICQINGIN